MKRTFTLHKPGGNVKHYFCGGNVRTEAGRMTFTVESPTHVFKFLLLKPPKKDQKLRAADVAALSPAYVLFGNGRKVSRPNFQLCKTEELSASERAARLLEIQTQPAAEHNPKKTAKNPKGSGRKPKGDTKTGDKIFAAWNTARKADGKLTVKEFWQERHSETMGYEEFFRIIDAARKRRNRRLGAG